MIFVILIFGLVLRLISINQSLWLDEATSALTTKMSLANFFTKFMPGDFHPPLYYISLRLWGTIFGTSEIALRSLSVLFGIVTVYVIFLIGKELIGKRTGLIAALLLATSGLHIYYSQEARMYAMSTFLVSLAIFLFIKILKNNRVGYWILFSITLGLIGLTDYLPLLILIPIWAFALISKKDFRWKLFLMSHIILVIFAVLWSPVFIKQLTSGINVTSSFPAWVNVLGKFSIKDTLLIPVKFMIGRVTIFNKKMYFLVVGGVTALFGFLIYRGVTSFAYQSRKYFERIKLIYLWLVVPVVLALIISIKIPVLNYFRFLFVLPAFYLVIACGVNGINKKWRGIFLILVILINLVTAGIYLSNSKFQREDWRSAAAYIASNKVLNSEIIFPADSQMEAYRYYAPQTILHGPEAVIDGYSEIWLVRYAQPISDPQDTTRLKIEKLGYKKVQELDFNGVTVWRYISGTIRL